MTVSTEIVSYSYKPGAAMVPEAIPFPFFDGSDIAVVQIAAADGARTDLVPGQYVIAGDGRAKQGTITATAIWPADDLFELTRATALVQAAQIVPHEALPAEQLEATLDRVVMGAQETLSTARDVGARALIVPPGDRGGVLPSAAQRANKTLAFGPDGDWIAAALPSGTVSTPLPAQIATAGQTLFDFDGLGGDLADVAVNGVVFTDDLYDIAGDTLTFLNPLNAGDIVSVVVKGGWSTALAFRDATPAAPGLMTQTDKIKADGIVDMKSIGAKYNSDYSNAQRFIDAVAELPRGGMIDLGHYGTLYTDEDINLPPNIYLKGRWYPQKPRTSWNYLDTCPSAIILEPSKTVNMDGSKLEHILFWQANINQNPQTPELFFDQLDKFDGNAFTAIGDNPAVNQCMFIGFARAGLIYNVFCPEITENVFDCLGGFDVSAVYDFRGRGISNNLGQAIYIQYKPWPIAVTRRPGKAIYVHDVADGVTVWQNKSFAYQAGLHLKNVFEVKASHIADGIGLPDPANAAGTRGIWLEGNLNGCLIDQSGAHGQETGWYIDTTGVTQLGNNTCGVAVKNQMYFGAQAHGHLGHMLLGGITDTPIAAAAGVGEWSGSIDLWSTATSGKTFFLFDVANKNAFRDVRRRYYDDGVALSDILPMGEGEYLWDSRPVNAKIGTTAFFSDSPVTAFGTPITGGGGPNYVKGCRFPEGWRVA